AASPRQAPQSPKGRKLLRRILQFHLSASRPLLRVDAMALRRQSSHASPPGNDELPVKEPESHKPSVGSSPTPFSQEPGLHTRLLFFGRWAAGGIENPDHLLSLWTPHINLGAFPTFPPARWWVSPSQTQPQ